MSPRKKQQPTAVAFESLFLFLLFRIESIHGMIDAMSQCVLDGVSGMNLRRLDKLDIFPVRALQDMLDDGVPVLWMAYTDAEAIERLTPETSDEGLDPIMPACRSLFTNACLSRRQVSHGRDHRARCLPCGDGAGP